MANEFIARKGLIALQNSSITGSLDITGSLVVNLQDTTANNPDYVVVDPSGNFSKKRSDGKTSPLITYQYKTSGTSPAAGEIIDKVFVGGTYQLLIATSSANNVDIDPSSDFFYTNVGSIIKLTSTSSGNFQMAKLVNNVVEESGYYQFLYTNANKISSGTIANNDIVNFEWDKSAGVGEGFSPSSNATTKLLANIYTPGYNWIDSFFGRFSTTDGTPQTLTNVDESGSFTETFYFLPAISETETLTLGGLTVTALTASNLNYPSADGTDGQTLHTDGAGNLTFEDINQIFQSIKNKSGQILTKGTPVYASGSSGNAADVYLADANVQATMPAAFIVKENIAIDAEGKGVISGFINGIDTSTFNAGETIYVAVGGGYTNVKPTGSALIQNIGKAVKIDASNGSLVVVGAGRSNDVPNITSGYAWVGNSDQVATAVATSSFVVTNANTASYVAAANIDGTIDISDQTNLAGGTNLTLSGDTMNLDANISLTSITASGNISASGDITGNNITAETTITSRGNIVISKTGATANEKLFTINEDGVEKFFIDEDGDINCDGSATVGTTIVASSTIRGTQFYASSGGSQSSPAYAFVSDSNSGIYQPAADNLNIQVGGGTAELSLNTSRVLSNVDIEIGSPSEITLNATGDITASGNISASGDLSIRGFSSVSSSLATYRTQIVSNGFYSQADKRYLTFNTTGETTTFNYLSLMPAPANGKLISISVWPQSGGGSTVIGLHINSNATAATTDTQTLSAGVPTTFTFSSNNTFSQNDEISFSIDPTSTPNGLFFSIILEYDL